MRTASTVAVLGAALTLAPAAGGGIIITPPAKKVCVGYDGGGVGLSVSLNRGWRPSPRHWFRIRLYNPDGRLVYARRDRLDYPGAAEWHDVMDYVPRRIGVFRTVFEAESWRPTTFRTRVYPCSD